MQPLDAAKQQAVDARKASVAGAPGADADEDSARPAARTKAKAEFAPRNSEGAGSAVKLLRKKAKAGAAGAAAAAAV